MRALGAATYGLLLTILWSFWASQAIADPPPVPSMQTLLVDKDSRGRITKETKDNYRRGRKVARDLGVVPVWISADAPYDPDISIEDSRWTRQQDAIRAVQDSVVARLESLNGGPISVSRTHVGPYFMIRAADADLELLAHDDDVAAFWIFVPNVQASE